MANLNSLIEDKINSLMQQHLVFDRDDPWDLSPCILREILLELAANLLARDDANRIGTIILQILSGETSVLEFGNIIPEDGSLFQLLKRYIRGDRCAESVTEMLVKVRNLELIRGGLWRALISSFSSRLTVSGILRSTASTMR